MEEKDMDKPVKTALCDWCGKPAAHITFRTLYEGTEFEQTSKYHECERCFRSATPWLSVQSK